MFGLSRALIVPAMALIVAAGCGDGRPDPTPTPTEPPAFGPGTPSLTALLDSNAAAMRSVGSLRFEVRTVIEMRAVRRPMGEQPNGGNPQSSPIVLQGVAMSPDKVSGTLIVGPPESILLQTDYVVIGDSGYRTHLSTGEWQLSPMLATELPSPLDFMGDSAAAFDDPVSLGIESGDGTDAYHIQARGATAIFGGPGTRPLADVWIAVDGAHLVQIEVETEIGPSLREQSSGSRVATRAERTGRKGRRASSSGPSFAGSTRPGPGTRRGEPRDPPRGAHGSASASASSRMRCARRRTMTLKMTARMVRLPIASLK